MDAVYSQKLLDLTSHVPRLGRLQSPTGTATLQAKLCGSSITVDVMVNDGVVEDYAHVVNACALGTAAAAIVAMHVVGSSVQELVALRAQMVAMLTQGGAPPQGKWAELALLQSIKDYPMRHASTLLVFDALMQATQT